MVQVNNVPPSAPVLSLSASTINAGGATVLSGSFDDPGTLDGHTVSIDWGDGSTPSTLALGPQARTFQADPHLYLNPGSFPITVTVTDQDGATSTQATTTVQVN